MVLFRAVRESDAARLAEIHQPYVKNTAITFVYQEPSEKVFLHKIQSTCEQYPFLVVEVDSVVMGFAYASQLRPHEAYQWDVELSIYMDERCQRQGLGTALYARLLRILTIQGFLNAYAVITLPNDKSLGLHGKFGFTQVGLFPHTGFKLGKWHDVIWLCKTLSEYPMIPAPPTHFSTFEPQELEALLL